MHQNASICRTWQRVKSIVAGAGFALPVGAPLAAPLRRKPSRLSAFRRRPLRLRGFDYSQEGAYFVTICTRNRECLFGDVVDGKMHGTVSRHDKVPVAGKEPSDATDAAHGTALHR